MQNYRHLPCDFVSRETRYVSRDGGNLLLSGTVISMEHTNQKIINYINIYLQMAKCLYKWNQNQVICSDFSQKLFYFSFTENFESNKDIMKII